MTLVWTRSLFYLTEDKQRLKSNGISYFLLPCLEYQVSNSEYIFPVSINKQKVVVFTSFLAAKVTLENSKLKPILSNAFIFVMGERTQNLLKTHDQCSILIKSSSAGEFSKKIKEQINFLVNVDNIIIILF